jgi:hypothetical protein
MLKRVEKLECRGLVFDAEMELFAGATTLATNRVVRWELHELHIAQSGDTPTTGNEHIAIEIIAGFDTEPTTANGGAAAGGLVDSPYPGAGVTGAMLPTESEFSGFLSGTGFVVLASETTTFYSDLVAGQKFSDGWNIQTPYSQVWMPNERPVIDDYRDSGYVTGQTYYWVVRLRPAPSVSLLIDATLLFERQAFTED